MAVNTELIQQLRAQTGAGILDAKKALDESGGDYDKAVEALRKRGQKVAAKKSDRQTSEGLVHSYIHGEGRVGVIVKINCETDFVARNEQFKDLAHKVAMHIAAYNPTYLSREDVPADVVEREKAVHQEMLAKEGKPADMMDKIIEGKLNKFYAEVCLLDQEFLMDDKMSVQEYVVETIGKIGENIQIAEYARLSL